MKGECQVKVKYINGCVKRLVVNMCPEKNDERAVNANVSVSVDR